MKKFLSFIFLGLIAITNVFANVQLAGEFADTNTNKSISLATVVFIIATFGIIVWGAILAVAKANVAPDDQKMKAIFQAIRIPVASFIVIALIFGIASAFIKNSAAKDLIKVENSQVVMVENNAKPYSI